MVFKTSAYLLFGFCSCYKRIYFSRFYDVFSISLHSSIIFTEYCDDKWNNKNPIMWIYFCPVASARQVATGSLSEKIQRKCNVFVVVLCLFVLLV